MSPSLPAKIIPSPAAGGALIGHSTDQTVEPSLMSKATSWLVRNGTYAWSSSNAGANAGGAGSVTTHFDFERERDAGREHRCGKNGEEKCDAHTRYGGAR